MNKQPFLGVFLTEDGRYFDIASNSFITPRDIKPKMTPFYGHFLDKDGVEHSLLDYIGKTGSAHSVDLMFFGMENSSPVLTHSAPPSAVTIIPQTYFPAEPDIWHDVITFMTGSDLRDIELEIIPGEIFTAKFWIRSDMLRDNVQFRLLVTSDQISDPLATGTVSVNLGTTGVLSPILINGTYGNPAVVDIKDIRMTLQILSPLFGVQFGIYSIPPNEISYISR